MQRASTFAVVVASGLILAACQPAPAQRVAIDLPAASPTATPGRSPEPEPSISRPAQPRPSGSASAPAPSISGDDRDAGQGGNGNGNDADNDITGGDRKITGDKNNDAGDSNSGNNGASNDGGDKPGGGAADSPTPQDGQDGQGGQSDSGPRAGGAGLGPVGAPRVLTAMHGSQALAAPGSDSQWSYVRANLDGLWGNAAGFSMEDQVALWEKITTRNLVGVRAVRDEPRLVDSWDAAEEFSPGLEINQEALALYTNVPSDWNGRSVAEAKSLYVHDPGANDRNTFTEIWTGWNIHNFTVGKDNRAPIVGSAWKAFNDAAGVFVECGSDRGATGYSEGFLNAINTAHANGKHFMWFANTSTDVEGRSGALKRFQDTYNFLRDKGLWHTNDVVMLINYDGAYPALPETVNGQPADTIAGMLYWALKQEK